MRWVIKTETETETEYPRFRTSAFASLKTLTPLTYPLQNQDSDRVPSTGTVEILLSERHNRRRKLRSHGVFSTVGTKPKVCELIRRRADNCPNK